ncbi:MAG: tetraacyldisaccharide 4'-kinase [Planctomycetaceae bacterium]|nr:tetraacyldisaccharide 4'-kinase [Planctomycetaceae bacterium]
MQEQFYDLVSGRKTGISASILRSALRLLEFPYSTVIACRNLLYDKNIFATHHLPVPMISVGNLTLGGTGKSPMTAWLCQHFLEQNLQPGLVSRGYGKGKHNTNDEFLEMSHRFPAVPHLQNPHRATAIQELLRAQPVDVPVDVIVLDDAFQHRQVARNLDIVLLDATAPFGFGHIFPRGTLREPVGELRRADVVLLTRADLVDEAQRQEIQQRVLAINPKIVWGETVHVPTALISPDSTSEAIESIRGRSALAFCGIGNPAAFRKTLERCGVEIAKLMTFPDHHRYSARDVDGILRTARELGTDLILCTMKDLVKWDATAATIGKVGTRPSAAESHKVGTRPPGGCVGAADWNAQNAEYRSCRPAVGNLPSAPGSRQPADCETCSYPAIRAVLIEIQFTQGESAVRECIDSRVRP